jgi:hypothetical protein
MHRTSADGSRLLADVKLAVAVTQVDRFGDPANSVSAAGL